MPHLANDSPLPCHHFLVPQSAQWRTRCVCVRRMKALDQDVNKRTTYTWGLAGVHVRVSGMGWAHGIMVGSGG